MKSDHIARLTATAMLSVLVLSVAPVYSGCGGDSGESRDFGDNDPNIVACMGDSITQGYMSIGEPYPARLATISGKTVLNFGVPGVQSDYGTETIGSVVKRKPGFICILYGTNDAIRGIDPDITKQHLRYIITVAKANKCIPILATLPKMSDSHLEFDRAATATSNAIRDLAKEENVDLVDLNMAFGDGALYLNPKDGLHLSDEGGNFVAQKFNAHL